jgi:hypothetical protein
MDLVIAGLDIERPPFKYKCKRGQDAANDLRFDICTSIHGANQSGSAAIRLKPPAIPLAKLDFSANRDQIAPIDIPFTGGSNHAGSDNDNFPNKRLDRRPQPDSRS